MKCLQGTKNYMLSYRHVENLKVIGCPNSNFIRCQDSKKYTLGHIFMLDRDAIS
jgi:hypothetical protein